MFWMCFWLGGFLFSATLPYLTLTSLPEPYRRHLSPLHVTLATLVSQYSHPSPHSIQEQSPSPLRVHLKPLVPSTVTHNSLDLRLGLFTPPYALPKPQVPIRSPPLALHSIGQAVPLCSHHWVCVPYLS
jgi:hypothetical protein